MLELDTPLLRTIVGLTIQPGRVAREYVEGARRKYANPLRYAFFTGALVVLHMHFAQRPAEGAGLPAGFSTDNPQAAWNYLRLLEFHNQYIAIIYLIALPGLAGLMRLSFWSGPRSVAEHYAFCLLAFGHLYLMQTFFSLLGLTLHLIFAAIAAFLPFVYFPFAAVGFTGRGIIRTVLLSEVALIIFVSVFALIYFAGGIVLLARFDPMTQDEARAKLAEHGFTQFEVQPPSRAAPEQSQETPAGTTSP